MIKILLSMVFITLILYESCSQEIGNCDGSSKLAILMNMNTTICKPFSVASNDFKNESYSMKIHSWNFKNNDIDVKIFDTCGNDVQTLKVLFETFEWAKMNCLKMPKFLGYIGPDEQENLQVTLKITSSLSIPHIHSTTLTATTLHYLVPRVNILIAKGILNLIEILDWNSISLIKKMEYRDDFMGNTIELFTEEALKKSVCITKDLSSNIVYFGQWDDHFFRNAQNKRIIYITDQTFDYEEKRDLELDASNSIIWVDKISIEKSMSLPLEFKRTNLHTHHMVIINEALNVYNLAYKEICQIKNCNIDYGDWNELIDRKIEFLNIKGYIEIPFKIRGKNLGGKIFHGKFELTNDKIQIYWNGKLLENENNSSYTDFADFRSNLTTFCETKISTNEMNLNKNKNNNDYKLYAGEEDWFQMIGAAAGVGLTIFGIGTFAVYTVFSNMRNTSDENFKRPEYRVSFRLNRKDSARTHKVARDSSFKRGENRNSTRSIASDNII